MDDKLIYLVFRVYTDDERPGIEFNDRVILYGWSSSKDVIKAFFSQRNKSKYQVRKVYEEDLARVYSETDLSFDIMIDMVELKVAATNEKIMLLSTKNELRQAEKDIHKMFRNLASIIEKPGSDIKVLELFMNLDDYYAKALEYLGFRPSELDDMFDFCGYRGASTHEEMYEQEIDDAYSGSAEHPTEIYKRDSRIPGLSVLTDISNKIIYSAESFIRVLRDQM